MNKRQAQEIIEKLPPTGIQAVKWTYLFGGVTTVDALGSMVSESPIINNRRIVSVRTLQRLVRLGLAEKQNRPRKRTATNTSRIYYFLTHKGIYIGMLLTGQLDIRRIERLRDKELATNQHIDHYLTILDTVSSIGAKRAQGELLTWQHDGRRTYDVKWHSKYRMVPDGYGIWTEGDDGETAIPFNLEVVLSMSHPEKIQKKMTRYLGHFLSGNYKKYEGLSPFPPILWVTNTVSKMKHLWKLSIGSLYKAGLPLNIATEYVTFGIALLEDVKEDAFGDCVWFLPYQGKSKGVGFTDLLPKRQLEPWEVGERQHG